MQDLVSFLVAQDDQRFGFFFLFRFPNSNQIPIPK